MPHPPTNGPSCARRQSCLLIREMRRIKASIQVQIRYRNPRAGEVQCVWGLNDFTLVPTQLPPGSFLTYNDSHVNTPMQRDGEVFVAEFEVPANTKFDYAFTITRTSLGEAVQIWAGEPGKGGAYYSRALAIADADEKSVDSKTY